MGFITSLRYRDRLRKLAGLFAGMNQMQPLLLATTNSNYLLDRFCMERCCSSEYISRIVTSIIFMEVMATLLVACLGVGITKWQGTTGQTLNKWNEDEEKIRGYISSIILCFITLGYFQIFYAFTTGGKKGHMHWFYVSLMIQQFVCLLIGGAIGFWDVGHALWYLMAIPVGPIPVFFYQLMIHSWIRNNGPRYPEYLVVEWQIGLALCISILATLFWIYAYCQPYYPIELEIKNLDSPTSLNPSSQDTKRINGDGTAKTLAKTATVQVSLNLGSVSVQADVTLTAYSVNLLTAKISTGDNKYVVTLTLKAAVKIQFSGSAAGAGTVEVESAKITEEPKKVTLKIKDSSSTPPSNITIKHVTPVDVKKSNDSKAVDISLTVDEITLTSNQDISSVEVTIPVNIKVTGATEPVIITTVKLSLPVPTDSSKNNLQLSPRYDSETLTITVEATQAGAGAAKANAVQVEGKGFTPKEGYCIYSVKDTTRDIWANIGGKCAFVACYKNGSSDNGALLILYLSTSGGYPEKKYFGKESNEWKTIPNEDKFIKYLKDLATSDGSLNLNGEGTATDQYNRDFSQVLGPFTNPSATWLPLVMQGLSVGAVGSIFPNLIPKTLTCPKTTRTLTVINMFMVPIPHIINLALADNNCNPSSKPWEGPFHSVWSLYFFYLMAILFAIFNVHSPEWKLCCYIRSHGWMPLMMTIFTNVLNEVFNAISRAGICSQKSADGTKKNHPCLHNKIACLMNLTYIPFWMTTTPMMKSYVSSLDPFLCDKDRDHWPTARYGRMKSFGYWCKCACRGLYTSPRKLITRDMRKALTRKDPKMYFLVTHDIPPEEWLWTSSSIITFTLSLLNRGGTCPHSFFLLDIHSCDQRNGTPEGLL